MMQSLIDWLNECRWHQLSTIAQPWTIPVSVREHSWPIFSLFLPVQSSLFPWLWAEMLFRPVSKTPRGCQYFQSDPRMAPTGINTHTCWDMTYFEEFSVKRKIPSSSKTHHNSPVTTLWLEFSKSTDRSIFWINQQCIFLTLKYPVATWTFPKNEVRT